MDCDYDICIYNENMECLFESVNINAFGVCEACILPNFDAGMLEKLKEETRRAIEELDRNLI